MKRLVLMFALAWLTPSMAHASCFEVYYREGRTGEFFRTLTVEQVIEECAPSDRSGESNSVLHYVAAYNDNPDVIAALVNTGVEVDVRGSYERTPLHWAAANNDNPEVIAALLDAGADVNARDYGKDTPLHSAAEDSDNPDVIAALLDAGANASLQGRSGDYPADDAERNNDIMGTDVYWELHDARFR